MLSDLFSPAAGQPLTGLFDPWHVLLSVVVAIFTATLALQMVDLAARGGRWLRLATIATGSVALGAGVWAMHFIGMLAFNLCVAVDYDPYITGLSMLPSLAASAVALAIISKPRLSRGDLLIGGVLVGGGIGAMHYVGMAALHMVPVLRYDLGFFLLSIAVAVVLAELALWIRFALRRHRFGLLASGAVMGSAISGMHYTGMAAARFYGDPALQSPDFVPDNGYLAFEVIAITLLVTLLVAVINALLRYRAMVIELTTSESRMAALTSTAVDGIISISQDGLILHANSAAERLFGWTTEEMAGRNVNMLMPEPYRSQHDGYLATYLESGEARIIGSAREVMARRKDGGTFPIRLAVGHARLPEGNMFVGYVTDITERRRLEQDLRDAKNRAEQAAAARTAFLANMSHEIRTPMNSILGFSEVLLNSKPTAEQAHALGIMRNSARSLLRLLNEILDSAKLDRGAMELLTLPFDLRAVAEEVIATQTTTADKKGLTLSFDYEEGLPTRFLGDELRIRQVLGNLLGNAVKFTEKGSVTVKVESQGAQIHITLSDTGIGIAPDRLERIFDPFTQADASLARRYGGTGLGTTISKQLVELMKGRIWVESELGKGSEFHVLLPLAPTNLALGDGADPGPGAAPSLPSLRILYADDVPQNLELVKMMLGPLGHQLTLVESGEAAVEKAAAETFDLILLDVRMPGISGLEAAARIRGEERRTGSAAVPIVALSASVLEEDRQQAFDAGMDGFAAKPIERPVLLREIGRVLGVGPSIDTEPAEELRSRPVFDRAGAMLRWDDDWVVLADMLEQFFAQHGGAADRLDQLLVAGDKSQAAALAHKIKGLAGNLGLSDLFGALATFEALLGQPSVDPDAALERVAVAMDAAQAAVEPDLRQGRGPEAKEALAELVALDPEVLDAALDRLHKAVKRGALDDAAFSILAAMLPAVDTADLRRALDDFDFPAADRLLDGLQAKRGRSYAG